MPKYKYKSIMENWLNRNRDIEWAVYLGVRKKTPIVKGTLSTYLSYIDDQGEKWGDTYVKVIGQHYEDYAHWDEIETFLPIGGDPMLTFSFVPSPYESRVYKGVAHGVTGLISEVLTTIFLQKVMKILPFQMAHLKEGNSIATPDFCLAIQPNDLISLIKAGERNVSEKNINNVIKELSSIGTWNFPIPLECKGRRQQKSIKQTRDALKQLLTYWQNVKSMCGFGVFAQINVYPKTKINIHIFAPKSSEVTNVKDIICKSVTGTSLVAMPDNPTVPEFNKALEGRMVE